MHAVGIESGGLVAADLAADVVAAHPDISCYAVILPAVILAVSARGQRPAAAANGGAQPKRAQGAALSADQPVQA